MVGRRVDQSRLGVRVDAVALVIVVLCFWHPATNGYQALAIPGAKKASRTKLGKRKLPQVDPADSATDVFIPLEGTVQSLEEMLKDRRVVFLRAAVASGKSTLARYLCTQQPSKYLQVHAPLHTDLTFENWVTAFKKAVEKHSIQHDSADITEAIKSIHNEDQVLVFDECHLLFACPEFCEMLTKTPSYLPQRPMVLLLSAVSEAKRLQGQIRLTPSEITDKFMWTPPVPSPSVLADQLAAASVGLSEDAIKFFFQICAGHRGIFMRAMAWVQDKQKKHRGQGGRLVEWTAEQAYGEVKLAWADEDWTNPNSFLGWLAAARAIRVNGHYANLENIPQQLVEILCSGATSNLDSELRRNLTVHGFLLPVVEGNADEFVPYDWSAVGARYGASTHLLASYYRCVLKKTRNLEVDVSMEVSSGTDLLLRALPYLHFAKVVGGVILQNARVQKVFARRGAPFEVHYTTAINQILERLGFSAGSVEDGKKGKVDVYVVLEDRTTIALEAVMVSRSWKEVESHRGRFDNPSLQNYHHATRKCLVILGGWGNRRKVRERVEQTQGGIEIVGLAANVAHTGYNVYVKRQIDNNIDTVVDFYIPCDGVARSFAFKDKEPFFEISSVQKLKSINPGPSAGSAGSAGTTSTSSIVWVRELIRKDKQLTAGSQQDFEPKGKAFKVKGELTDVDDLKKAIKAEEELSIAASKIDVYSQKEDGRWETEEMMSVSLRHDTTEANCYGFVVPSADDA